ncbi:keratinocyte proline-rich protein-like [Uranotaenia lowii]|uniref:keratinocyte proline-rich protein-like n=1 Tax=Uranotaenia lowii TaxID=190385 RepID=UPI00247A9345|nr:keratinocyte proline-rich protein-like [Uranotaenia lowii]
MTVVFGEIRMVVVLLLGLGLLSTVYCVRPPRTQPCGKCAPSEVLRYSPPSCEPTCTNDCFYRSECTKNPVRYKPTCVCKPGFVRDKGVCIPKEQCFDLVENTNPEGKACCPPNEELQKCPPCCEPTCDNDCTDLVCPLIYVDKPTCVCKAGLVRHEGRCIVPNRCPVKPRKRSVNYGSLDSAKLPLLTNNGQQSPNLAYAFPLQHGPPLHQQPYPAIQPEPSYPGDTPYFRRIVIAHQPAFITYRQPPLMNAKPLGCPHSIPQPIGLPPKLCPHNQMASKMIYVPPPPPPPAAPCPHVEATTELPPKQCPHIEATSESPCPKACPPVVTPEPVTEPAPTDPPCGCQCPDKPCLPLPPVVEKCPKANCLPPPPVAPPHPCGQCRRLLN